MLRIVAVGAALAASACAANQKPITSDEFAPHGRFQPEERERALAQCRYEAEREARDAGSRERQRGGAFMGAVYGIHAHKLALESCMNAKGYAWTSPR